MVTSIATRQVYGETLVQLGTEDNSIVVLGGDLNQSTGIAGFAKEFPERFYDFGAAEQNMMSVAAGLASSGKTVFASTFAVFGTSRPFDQIRVGIAQPKLNVKIVVTHSGLLTAEDGASAQSIEDLSLMCALPTFTVIVPADGPETAQAVRLAAQTPGPFYIRLSRPATPVIHDDAYSFALGQPEQLREGNDVTIIASGPMVHHSLVASEALSSEGIKAGVINVATFKPIEPTLITSAAKNTNALVTVEEHYIHGGLNSIISQITAKHCPVPIEAIAVNQYAESGKADALFEKYGLSSSKIVAAAKKAIQRKTEAK